MKSKKAKTKSSVPEETDTSFSHYLSSHMNSIFKDDKLSSKLLQSKISQIISEGSQNELSLKTFLFQLVLYAILNPKSHSIIFQVFKEFFNSKESNETIRNSVETLLVEIFWLHYCYFSTEEIEKKESLYGFIMDALRINLVNPITVKTILQPELLEQIGQIPDANILNRKIIKLRTDNKFTQHKYNLFREASEGYSMLLVFMQYYKHLQHFSQDLIDKIQSTIGYFDLDPNKVIDIILSHCYTRSPAFIPLFSYFNKHSICHVLGAKYEYFNSNISNYDEEDLRRTYQITSFLLEYNIIDITELYNHLSPLEQQLINERDERINKNIELLKDPSSLIISSFSDESDTKLLVLESETLPRSSPKEKDKDSEEGLIDKEILYLNQKSELLEVLFQNKVQEPALWMLNRLKSLFLTSSPIISKAICNLLSEEIEPFYAKIGLQYRAVGLADQDSSSDKMDVESTTENPIKSIETIKSQELNITLDAFFDLTWKWLSYLRCYICHDITLFCKLCRILTSFRRQDINKNSNESLSTSYEFFMCEVLLPAFSLITPNIGVSYELWNLLSTFSVPIRYSLYGIWKDQLYNNDPALMEAEIHSIKKARFFQKRTSSSSKNIGKQLAKFAQSNPLIVLETLLEKAIIYDNMINIVVESLKYLSPLAIDCVPFLLLKFLSAPKNKLKEDGINFSHSFQSLATITGAFYRKYPEAELGVILEYILIQLSQDSDFELLLLKELISYISGIEAIEDISNMQLYGQAGGRKLRSETAFSKITSKAPKGTINFLSALKKNTLIPQFLIAISYQQISRTFNFNIPHLRVIGESLDRCQDAFLQFLEFLTTNMDISQYLEGLPSFYTLIHEYHVSTQAAFAIIRPVRHSLRICSSDKLSPNNMDIEGDNNDITNFNPAFNCLVDTCTSCFSNTLWEAISPQLYTRFWLLSISDIFVPIDYYSLTIKRLRTEESDSTDKLKNQKYIEKAIESLSQEMTQQEQALVISDLKKEKDVWLRDISDRKNTIPIFMKNCIIPRCIFSPIDALYCAKFIMLLHQLNTPFLSTAQIFNEISLLLSPLLFSCTANEASRFGRFLKEMLQVIHSWTIHESSFNKEFYSMEGSIDSSLDSNSPRIDFLKWKKNCRIWHKNMLDAFINALEVKNGKSKQPTSVIRNCCIIIEKIKSVFPKITEHGEILIQNMQNVITTSTEKLSGIKVLVVRCQAALKLEKSSWVDEKSYFGLVTPDKEKEIKTNKKPEIKEENKKTEKKEDTNKSIEEKRSTHHSKTADQHPIRLHNHEKSDLSSSDRRKTDNFVRSKRLRDKEEQIDYNEGPSSHRTKTYDSHTSRYDYRRRDSDYRSYRY